MTELFLAMVAYCHSNLGSKLKWIVFFLKLDIALAWAQLNIQVFLSHNHTQFQSLKKIVNSTFMAIGSWTAVTRSMWSYMEQLIQPGACDPVWNRLSCQRQFFLLNFFFIYCMNQVIQGDLWEVTIVILLWRIERCLNRTNKKNSTRVYIGMFDFLPLFIFGPKKLAIKKIANVFGNHVKVANYAGFHN